MLMYRESILDMEVSLLERHPGEVVPLPGYFFRLLNWWLFFWRRKSTTQLSVVGMLTRQPPTSQGKIQLRVSKRCLKVSGKVRKSEEKECPYWWNKVHASSFPYPDPVLLPHCSIWSKHHVLEADQRTAQHTDALYQKGMGVSLSTKTVSPRMSSRWHPPLWGRWSWCFLSIYAWWEYTRYRP